MYTDSILNRLILPTDFIVHFSVRQKVAGALMELVTILVADAVHHHVVVQMRRASGK